MHLLIVAVKAQVERYEGNIHPELAENSRVFREIMSAGDELMSIGIDPATAAVIVAAVPITLRLLKMLNEYSLALLRNWEADKELDRERRRRELDRQHKK